MVLVSYVSYSRLLSRIFFRSGYSGYSTVKTAPVLVQLIHLFVNVDLNEKLLNIFYCVVPDFRKLVIS